MSIASVSRQCFPAILSLLDRVNSELPIDKGMSFSALFSALSRPEVSDLIRKMAEEDIK